MYVCIKESIPSLLALHTTPFHPEHFAKYRQPSFLCSAYFIISYRSPVYCVTVPVGNELWYEMSYCIAFLFLPFTSKFMFICLKAFPISFAEINVIKEENMNIFYPYIQYTCLTLHHSTMQLYICMYILVTKKYNIYEVKTEIFSIKL